MAKLVKKYSSDFFVTTNKIFFDTRLSYQELGLLLELLSLPDDWDFSVRGLSILHVDGKSTVARTLNKLIEYGYLHRDTKEQTRTEKGLFDKLDYFIYDNPLENPHYKPDKECLSILSQKPFTDNRNTDNGTKYNINKSSTKKYTVVDKDRFVKAIQNEKERFIEANQTDKYVLETIDYVIDAFNCFGDTNKKYINNFDSEDYVELFRIAYFILNDDADFANIEKDKAYFSNEIKKHINKQIEMRNAIC